MSFQAWSRLFTAVRAVVALALFAAGWLNYSELELLAVRTSRRIFSSHFSAPSVPSHGRWPLHSSVIRLMAATSLFLAPQAQTTSISEKSPVAPSCRVRLGEAHRDAFRCVKLIHGKSSRWPRLQAATNRTGTVSDALVRVHWWR